MAKFSEHAVYLPFSALMYGESVAVRWTCPALFYFGGVGYAIVEVNASF